MNFWQMWQQSDEKLTSEGGSTGLQHSVCEISLIWRRFRRSTLHSPFMHLFIIVCATNGDESTSWLKLARTMLVNVIVRPQIQVHWRIVKLPDGGARAANGRLFLNGGCRFNHKADRNKACDKGSDGRMWSVDPTGSAAGRVDPPICRVEPMEPKDRTS